LAVQYSGLLHQPTFVAFLLVYGVPDLDRKEDESNYFCLPGIAIAFSAQMRNIAAAEKLRSISSL
jgi:hypothetical protein